MNNLSELINNNLTNVCVFDINEKGIRFRELQINDSNNHITAIIYHNNKYHLINTADDYNTLIRILQNNINITMTDTNDNNSDKKFRIIKPELFFDTFSKYDMTLYFLKFDINTGISMYNGITNPLGNGNNSIVLIYNNNEFTYMGQHNYADIINRLYSQLEHDVIDYCKDKIKYILFCEGYYYDYNEIMRYKDTIDEIINRDETILIRKFLEENDILDKIASFPISDRKIQEFIDSTTNIDEKNDNIELIKNVKHISNAEFINQIRSLCNRYNQSKKSDDIYILLYTPFFDFTGAGKYSQKSNFYATNIAGNFLNYDYIFDMTDNKFHFLLDYIIYSKIKALNLNKKNIYFYICDDCSYSGTQLEQLINGLNIFNIFDDIDLINKYIRLRLIIPYILSNFDKYIYYSTLSEYFINNFNRKKFIDGLRTFNNSIYIKVKKNYSDKIYKDGKIISKDEYQKYQMNQFLLSILPPNTDLNKLRNEWFYDYKNILLIDIEPIKDILIKNNKSVKKSNDILKKSDSKNWLIYFDFKIGDRHSAERYIIKNILEKEPDREYEKIIYLFNGKKIIFGNSLYDSIKDM
jgi:hypothetical protein